MHRKQRRIIAKTKNENTFSPTLDGHNTEKLDFFRMDKTKKKNDPKRYPLGRFPVRCFISFGKYRDTSDFAVRLNSNVGVSTSFNKLLTKQKLRAAAIPVVNHVEVSDFCTTEDDGVSIDLTPLLSNLNGFPLIAKPVKGEQGEGVKKLNNLKELIDFVQEDEFFGENVESYIIEDYFKHTSELRFHVSPWLENWVSPSGEKFTDGVFTIQKFIRPGNTLEGENVSFTTQHNLSNEKKTELSKVARKAIKHIGLDFGAVDFLLNSDGTYVVGEVNSNPYMNTEGTYENPGYMIKVYRQALATMLVNKCIERGYLDAPKSASAMNVTNSMSLKVNECAE